MSLFAKSDGRCLCGAVWLEARWPSKWVAHCHCSRCQRAHGAGVVTWTGFEQEKVCIQDPDGQLRWYRSDDPADADGPPGERGFCCRCGSPMFFRSARWPGELHIARALLAGPLDRAPQAHVFYDTHVDWLILGDTLPRSDDATAAD